jgi:C1A family cysteine protease
MPRISSSAGGRALEIMEVSLETVKSQLNTSIASRLKALSKKANSVVSFIYGYQMTEDESFDTDDEILNWTIIDVVDDLSAAIWNLGSGFYKTSASCQRGALEMAAVSLYFQRLENEKPVNGGYNKAFADWDCGITSTPNWGTIKHRLQNHPLILQFKKENGFCEIHEAYKHFEYLCSFTHSRAFSPQDGKGTNSMNMLNQVGEYNEQEFQRIAEAMDKTIAEIASIWAITYPHTVAEWTDDGVGASFLSLDDLFCTSNSKKALEFARKCITT